MSLDYPPQVLRPPFRRAFRLPFRSPAGIEGILSQAIGDFNEDGIVTDGSGFVTAWNNSASIAGALPDLDVVVGTLANSSVISVNGHNSVSSTGSYALESTLGTDIPSGAVVFAVARMSASSPPADQYIIDARSPGADRWLISSENVSSDNFTIYQGGAATASLTEGYDNLTHVFTAQYNGDSTSKLTVSGVGTISGDIGNKVWDYGTLFANSIGNLSLKGSISRLLVFASELSEAKVAQIQDFLFQEYRL